MGGHFGLEAFLRPPWSILLNITYAKSTQTPQGVGILFCSKKYGAAAMERLGAAGEIFAIPRC